MIFVLSCRSAHLDERDPGLADLYFEYGRCLLAKAQKQSGLLGDKAQKRIDEVAADSEQVEPAEAEDDDENGNDQSSDGDVDADAEEPERDDEPGAAADAHSNQQPAENGEEGDHTPVDNQSLTEAQKQSLMQHVKSSSECLSLLCFHLLTCDSVTDLSDGKDDSTQKAAANREAEQPQPFTVKKPAPEPTGIEHNKPTSEDQHQDKKLEGDDLELSWTVLELARVLFAQTGKKSRVADVHMHLGEIAMEGDNMQAATEEFQKCADIRKILQPYDARALAEAHFLLACAYEQSTEAAVSDAKQASTSDPQDMISAVVNAAQAFDAEAYQAMAEKALINFKEARRILEEEIKSAQKDGRAESVEDLRAIIQEISAKIEVVETKAPDEQEFIKQQQQGGSVPGFDFGSEFGSGPATAPPTSFNFGEIVPGGRTEKPVAEFNFSFGSDGGASGATGPQFAKFDLPTNVSFNWTPPPAAAPSPAAPSGFQLPSSGSSRKRVAPMQLPVESTSGDTDASGGQKRKAEEISGGPGATPSPAKKPNLSE